MLLKAQAIYPMSANYASFTVLNSQLSLLLSQILTHTLVQIHIVLFLSLSSFLCLFLYLRSLSCFGHIFTCLSPPHVLFKLVHYTSFLVTDVWSRYLQNVYIKQALDLLAAIISGLLGTMYNIKHRYCHLMYCTRKKKNTMM